MISCPSSASPGARGSMSSATRIDEAGFSCCHPCGVVKVHRLLHGFETEVVGRAVDRSSLHPAAGKPHREPEGIVVAAVLDHAGVAADFHDRRAPEFGSA